MDLFKEIVSFENLYSAYRRVRLLKRYYPAQQKYEFNLETNLCRLQQKLRNPTKYKPRPYRKFTIHEPKKRRISAPHFEDRIVHQAIVGVIGPGISEKFIPQTYACIKDRGTHKAVFDIKKALGELGTGYYLKADISGYFASINHKILKKLLRKYISCPKTLCLLDKIIDSYESAPVVVPTKGSRTLRGSHEPSFALVHGGGGRVEENPKGSSAAPPRNPAIRLSSPSKSGKHPPGVKRRGLRRRGIPIGNLTSQLFANLYLNELDWFVAGRNDLHYFRPKGGNKVPEPKAKGSYFRYMDDFVVISEDKNELIKVRDEIEAFLQSQLKLALHPRKRLIQRVSFGVDFCGYQIFPNRVVLRKKTIRRFVRGYKRRWKKLENLREQLASYLSPELSPGLEEEISDLEGKLERSVTSHLGFLKHSEIDKTRGRCAYVNKVRLPYLQNDN